MTDEEFEAAGLYDPSSPRAGERLELLRWLEAQGVSLQSMKSAESHGRLIFAASMQALRPGPFLTLNQLSERLRVPASEIERFRIAFALPPVHPDAPWCNENEAKLFEAVAQGVDLFGSAGMLRLARVLGSSVSRVAEAMATTNHERMVALLGSNPREVEIAQANHKAIVTAGAPAMIITGLLGIHLQLAANRIRDRRAYYAQETIDGCVGFVDVVGSTTLSRRLSVKELADFVDRFEEVASATATNRGGRVVKFIGDEVMFVTADAASACDIALTLIDSFAGDPAITPRAGLACGALLDRTGDYYGPVVNLAARLAELAVPREVLVTSEVAAQIRGKGYVSEGAGRRQLRGFDEPVQLMTVVRETPSPDAG